MNIIEPNTIPYSFDTLGWRIVLGLLVLSVLLAAFLLWRKWKRNKYRRDGIRLVQSSTSMAEINHQMKLTALKLWERERVAALQGVEWLIFLNSTMKNAYTETHLFEAMAEAIYSGKKDEELLKEFKNLAEMWFLGHKREEGRGKREEGRVVK
ncbi:MAG: DUF4381 domain-containing protein [Mangrovibacterium sp.]